MFSEFNKRIIKYETQGTASARCEKYKLYISNTVMDMAKIHLQEKDIQS